MFGIPLVLYPILLLLIGSIGISKKKQFTETPARVAVVNGEAAPRLVDLLEEKDSGAEVKPSEHPEADLAAIGPQDLLDEPRPPRQVNDRLGRAE